MSLVHRDIKYSRSHDGETQINMTDIYHDDSAIDPNKYTVQQELNEENPLSCDHEYGNKSVNDIISIDASADMLDDLGAISSFPGDNYGLPQRETGRTSELHGGMCRPTDERNGKHSNSAEEYVDV